MTAPSVTEAEQQAPSVIVQSEMVYLGTPFVLFSEDLTSLMVLGVKLGPTKNRTDFVLSPWFPVLLSSVKPSRDHYSNLEFTLEKFQMAVGLK